MQPTVNIKNTTYQAMQPCENNSVCLYITAIYTDVSRGLSHRVVVDCYAEVLEDKCYLCNQGQRRRSLLSGT